MWAGGAAVGILSTKFLVDKNTTQLASSVENESETSASISRHEMALKTVQVFFRHGARTPIRQLAVLEELDAVRWLPESLYKRAWCRRPIHFETLRSAHAAAQVCLR